MRYITAGAALGRSHSKLPLSKPAQKQLGWRQIAVTQEIFSTLLPELFGKTVDMLLHISAGAGGVAVDTQPYIAGHRQIGQMTALAE